jgi:hypothetical protein
MDEMIRYIFGSLRCSENAMRVFAKTLRKQKSINRTMSFFAVVATANIVIQGMEITALRDELQNLKKEIKELKNTEGD